MIDNNPDSFKLIVWLVPIIIPVLAGFVGVFIGAWLMSKQQRKQQRLSFIEKQLKYFYSPLLGLRKEIFMLSDFREKISRIADAEWKELCEKERNPDALRKLTEDRWEEFDKIIKYDNRQLTETLIPSYNKMVTIFRENYYLAEKQTLDYFQSLLEFVNIWDRWLDHSLPKEVNESLEQNEETLKPLYADIKKTHDELRTKLSDANDHQKRGDLLAL